MAKNEYPHLFITNAKSNIGFSPGKNPIITPLPARNRKTHAQYLTERFNTAWQQEIQYKEARTAVSLPAKDGFYIEFKSQAGYNLTTKSLESIKNGIRLLNVRYVDTGSGSETYATVYVPKDKANHFLKKVREYAVIDTDTGKPKNQNLIASIEDVVLAARLNSFWQDAVDLMPEEHPVWCEAWLSYSESDDPITIRRQFYSTCTFFGIEYKREYLHFPERLVVLIKANYSQLIELIESSDLIAEFRRAQETASYWVEQRNFEQVEWVRDLIERLDVVETGVAITILDGGVNNGHLLLQPVLDDSDCLTYNPDWGSTDNHKHGTLMSGIAAYGNLIEKLEHSLPVEIIHRLESVKILPPRHHSPNPIELWGDITSQAVSLAEIANPDRLRVICMAVTSVDGTDRGRPSSWSASIDALTSGAEDGVQRLFIISAGNTSEEDWGQYPESNLQSPIQSPAQAWNALTVGAFTNKVQINEREYKGYQCLANAGCLSPFSSTSHSWDTKRWPVKPDIVMEGGNLMIAPDGLVHQHHDLSQLTTSSLSILNQFDTINMTSAATAEASWFAAQLMAQYPDAWPETIRGLIIHSAEWTGNMISQFRVNFKRKGDVARLLRSCGYGVPNLKNAVRSLNNSLTLIAEENIQPFCKRESGGGYKAKDMHFYELPWPVEQLMNLGEENVQVRITLSYFVEPGAGEIGWKDRYRYASHGLRFDMNTPTENKDEFIKRINAAAREEDEVYSGNSGSERWVVGSVTRNHGSIHSDIFEGTAAEVAACRYIGIYPVIGWWRERTNLKMWDKSTRYSLIISLNTRSQKVDLYTPVMNMVKTTTTITM